MKKKLNISIIFNDPVQYAKGVVYEGTGIDIDDVPDEIDMSEYGVLDEVRARAGVAADDDASEMQIPPPRLPRCCGVARGRNDRLRALSVWDRGLARGE